MRTLEEIRPSVERLVAAISNTLKLEIAIFDKNSDLFFCTPTYLKKKGKMVHTPFITDVLTNGSVLVNKPGEMSSCIGCRFKDHCTSTVEVLCCIPAGTEIAGVAAFTSFTKEGERRINENTAVYLDAITGLSTLIGEYLQEKSGNFDGANLDTITKGALEISRQPLVLADPYGVIMQYNQMAAKVFKLCGLGASSLWQILPEDMIRKMLKGIDLFERPVSIGEYHTKITSKAIKAGGRVTAVFIRFSDDIYQQVETPDFLNGIVGKSHEIEEIKKLVKKLADSPTPILITGETGTGKELVARAIHEQSHRNKYAFVAINCSSIPENLFESELFGYEEGSFTGARKGGKVGRIEMAQGGTLFLDEIGEMPLSVQPKLLRVLQEYELERVGSTERIHLDIRIIAATNRNLEDMIEEGSFREDLFYRVGVINMKLPPLRERKNDILPIGISYLERLKTKLNTPLKGFDSQVEELFLTYSWPGNIRELQNVVEHGANLCEGEQLTLRDLPESVVQRAGRLRNSVVESKEDVDQIQRLLEKYGHTLEGKKQVAKEMGISLRTLYRKLGNK